MEAETSRNQCWGRKNWTESWEAEGGQLWELETPNIDSHRKDAKIFWGLTLGAQPGSHSKYQG